MSLGMFNAPKRQRIVSGLRHVRNRAPFLGGNFALWGGIFSTTDCLLISVRQTDDYKNACAAGFITGGVLAIRGGAQVAAKQAFMGGVVLALIEGASNLFMQQQMKQQHLMMQAAQREQIARMHAMANRGGENPWEVEYSKEKEKNIAEAAAGDNMVDNTSVSGS